jgi:excinuclease ABC subunit C
VLVARRVERDGSFYAGPFLPAHFARKTMALTHRLFGIRSCNEVITGKRGRPCLEYDIKRCIAPCVDTVCSPDEYASAVKLTQLFWKARTTSSSNARRAHAGCAGVVRAAQLRDAVDGAGAARSPAGNGHHRVRASRRLRLKLSPAGAAIRCSRSAAAASSSASSSEPRTPRRLARGEVLEAAVQQFYELRAAPPEIHLPSGRRTTLEWLSSAGLRAHFTTPQPGEKRGLVDLATRNAALISNQVQSGDRRPATRRDAAGCSGAARRGASSASTSRPFRAETVASMVVCEDGRMRGEPRKFPDQRGFRTGFGIWVRDSERLRLRRRGHGSPRRGVGVSSRQGWGPAASK